ncbi:MAG TPA: MoaD/ThiS family protein [Rhizomicrobium sp.]|nr:MoaD/ThiS family protein [Rhizomicrobium sp.]
MADVKLVFLGRFRELAGARLSDVPLPAGVRTLQGLQDWLARTEPDLAVALTGARTQVAINQTLVRDPAYPIGDRDEIAFLPPMSGG